jgi:hypothetical protein
MPEFLTTPIIVVGISNDLVIDEEKNASLDGYSE